VRAHPIGTRAALVALTCGLALAGCGGKDAVTSDGVYTARQVLTALEDHGLRVRVFKRPATGHNPEGITEQLLSRPMFRHVRALVADYRTNGTRFSVGNVIQVWVLASAKAASNFNAAPPGRLFRRRNLVVFAQPQFRSRVLAALADLP
jgi:hypothetical protein